MKYMLLVYLVEKSFHERSESERSELLRESVHLANQLHSTAQYFDAAPLHPSSETKCVRMRGGKKILTDGPLAETHEQVAGYFLINARDLNEAIEIATREFLAHILEQLKYGRCRKSTDCLNVNCFRFASSFVYKDDYEVTKLLQGSF